MSSRRALPNKVLLFFPPYQRLISEDMDSSICSSPRMSLGPASVAMYLRHTIGISAQVYCASDHSVTELESILRAHKPEIIGISCWSYNRFACLELAQLAKRVDPNMVTVLGGVHATFLDRQILFNYPEVDYIVRGEGEVAFLELIQALAGGFDLAGVRGITFRGDGDIIRTRNREWGKNLDDFPIIDYKTIALGEPRYLKQEDKDLYLNNVLPVETSRGCPYACLFCSGVGFMGRGASWRNVDSVMKQIEKIAETSSPGIFFHDMNFTLNREYVVRLCGKLIECDVKVPWLCTTRIDLVDQELVVLLKKAGCQMIFYGVDSLCQKILSYTGRNYCVENAIEMLNWTVAQGIKVEINLIIGFPHETQGDRMETLRNIQRLDRRVQINISGLMVLPGSQIYSIAIKEGFDESYWLAQHDDILPYYAGTLSSEEMQKWITLLKAGSVKLARGVSCQMG